MNVLFAAKLQVGTSIPKKLQPPAPFSDFRRHYWEAALLWVVLTALTLGTIAFVVRAPIDLSEPVQLWVLQAGAISLSSVLLSAVLIRARIPAIAIILAVLLYCVIIIAMRHSDIRSIYRWHALAYSGVTILILAFVYVLLRLRPLPSAQPFHLRSWWHRHRWPFATYMLLSSWYFSTYISRLDTHVIGDWYIDNFEFTWKMWWFAEALVRRHTTAAWTPDMYAPEGFEMALADMTPAHTLLGVPLTIFFGAPAAYNIVLVFSTFLSACCAYLLVERITHQRFASCIAGVLFAFCTYRHINLAGRLPLMGTQWIALAFYGWVGFLQSRRMWDVFVAALGVVLTAWSSWYYAPVLLILLAFFSVIQLPYRQPRHLVVLGQGVILAFGITATLLLPYAQPSIEGRALGIAEKHPVSELLLHSATISDFLYPNLFHPLYGNWVSQHVPFSPGEHWAPLGPLTMILGAGGVLVSRRQRASWAWLAVAFASLTFALGPYARLVPTSSLTLPTPILWFYNAVPVLDSMRAWSRMVIFAILALVVLGGIGLARIQRRHYVWLSVVLALALFELWSVPLGMADASIRPVEQWIATQPNQQSIMYYPGTTAPASQYFASLARRKLVTGYSTFVPPRFKEIAPTLGTFPTQESLALLHQLDVRYVIVEVSPMDRYFGADWRANMSKANITEVYKDQQFVVYAVP